MLIAVVLVTSDGKLVCSLLSWPNMHEDSVPSDDFLLQGGYHGGSGALQEGVWQIRVFVGCLWHFTMA